MDPVILSYKTEWSTYEVDHTGPGFRVRRVKGVNEPTPHTGQDGVWQDATSIETSPDKRLLITWAHGGQTVTSPIKDVRPVRICAHCGDPMRGHANADGQWLCHPDEGLDCYHLVTVYAEPVGARRGGATPPPPSDSAPFDLLPGVVR